MSRTPAPSSKRRPVPRITLGRASRLHRLVRLLADAPRPRDEILDVLGVGLRTVYREFELLNRCGVRVRLNHRAYVLHATVAEAEARLPFPDPQLSFAEMAELARHDGPASKRLADLLGRVTAEPDPPKRRAAPGTPPKKSGGRTPS